MSPGIWKIDLANPGPIGEKTPSSVKATKLLFATATELTIVTGAITKTQTLHRIDTEADVASDDLDTIGGGADGDIIIVRAENTARTVVLKNGTGNLKLSGADITLDDTDLFVILIYDGILTKWVLVGGGGDMSAATYDPASKSEQLLGISDIQTIIDDPGSDTKIPSEQATREALNAIDQKKVKSTYFATIASGTTSGQITKPAGAGADVDFIMDEWGTATDALISTIENGKPTFKSPVNAAGNTITVTLDTSGNYAFSDTPSPAASHALIYVYTCYIKNFNVAESLWETELLDYVADHKTSHENGGSDEISVAGLSGLLADDQHVLDAEVLAVAVDKSTFTQNGGFLVGTGAGTYQEETGATARASMGATAETDLQPPAPVAFAGSSGRTITHNYGHTDYQLIINPVADPAGFLGEIWFSKASNTAVVYNSGSATGNFDYVIIPSS